MKSTPTITLQPYPLFHIIDWSKFNKNVSVINSIDVACCLNNQRKEEPYMFSKTENTTTEAEVQVDKTNEDDSVTVYVWSSGLNSLGHVSIKFSDDPSHYWSIWPKSTPAGGLTSILPLKAALAPKLEDDCMQEAIRPKEDFTNLMQPDEILPQQPDKVFVVHGLDKQKMKKEFTRIEQGIDSGEVSYQLLPAVRLVNFVSRLFSTQPKDEVYNCVTLTGHLLKVGGKDNLNCNPWQTPSNFADQLINLDRVQLVSPTPSASSDGPKSQSDKPALPAAVSIKNRLTSRWFTDDDCDDYSNSSPVLTQTSSENQEPLLATLEDTSRPKVSESSFTFFDRGNDDSSAILQQRDKESDLNYVSRIDAMIN
ncbi:TPA: hypothetical protein JA361_06995 [Legionella pneumophila]|nr:hypothetical protein [Legionella pneumophila]HAT8181637.1 hypothetical protein [Legionella pneumophila]